MRRIGLQEQIFLVILSDGKGKEIAASCHRVYIHGNRQRILPVEEPFRELQKTVASAYGFAAVQIEHLSVLFILDIGGPCGQFRVVLTRAVGSRAGIRLVEIVFENRFLRPFFSFHDQLNADGSVRASPELLL